MEAKNFAIRGLQGCTIDIAERVSIYQNYRADIGHLIPLFAGLCIRTDGPTDDESDKMGAKTSLMIFRVRERLRSSGSTVDLAAATAAISSAFGYNDSSSNGIVRGALLFLCMGILFFIINTCVSFSKIRRKRTLVGLLARPDRMATEERMSFKTPMEINRLEATARRRRKRQSPQEEISFSTASGTPMTRTSCEAFDHFFGVGNSERRRFHLFGNVSTVGSLILILLKLVS